jgi:hypothetical protein
MERRHDGCDSSQSDGVIEFIVTSGRSPWLVAVGCSEGLGRVLIGCNAKALTLCVCDWLDTGRRIGLLRIDDANLDHVTEGETAVKPLQVLLVADTAHSKTHDMTAWCIYTTGQHDVRHD